MKTLRILKKPVGEAPQLLTIEHTLENLQEHVGGGYIDIVRLGAGILLVVNDEGKLNGSQPNFDFLDDVICGDCFFVAEGFVDGEMDFIDLTDRQIALILNGQIDFKSEPKNEPIVHFEFVEWADK